jgi:undecaprenyl diphosphate synthase
MEEHTALRVPTCIGFITDGNRRWAKEQGLPQLEGHRAGYEKFKDIVTWAKARGVRNLIFYGFSTENWSRLPDEVAYLMNLFRLGVKMDENVALKERMRLRVIGEVERLAPYLRESIKRIEAKTANFLEGTIALAISYGGRAEIVGAVNRILQEGRKSPVDEKTFSSYLWTHDIPDPDLVIRTGKEVRTSNFLPWQSVYSEFYFTDTYWPALGKEEFDRVLDEYEARERRMGR